MSQSTKSQAPASPFEFEVSDDAAVLMELAFTDGLSVETVVAALEAQGVTHGIIRSAIADAVRTAKATAHPVRGIRVAEARKPMPGIAGRIENLVQTGEAVLAGAILAVRHDPVEGVEGITVRGKTVAAGKAAPGPNLKSAVGANTSVSGDGVSVVSSTYGLVTVDGGRISVEPLVELSGDELTATVTVRGVRSGQLNADVIRSAAMAAGVTVGLRTNVIEEAVAHVLQTHLVVENLVIAEGTRAEPAKPAHAEALANPGEVVGAGAEIAVQRGASEATPGMSVRGRPINPPRVQRTGPARLQGGAGTELTADGHFLRSTGYGTVVLERDAYRVVPTVEVSNDESRATIDILPVVAGTLTIEAVLAGLLAAGVTHGARVEDLKRAIEQVTSSGQPARRVLAAQSVPAKAGTMAPPALDVVDGQLVRAGAVLGRQGPPTPPAPGYSVRGKESPAPSTPKDPRGGLAPGANVVSEDGTLRATIGVCGYVHMGAGKIDVVSPLAVSTDAMAVHLTVSPPVEGASPLARDDVTALLKAQGVVAGVDWEAVDIILKANQAGGIIPEAGLIAKGTLPVHGQDASIRYIGQDTSHAGQARDDGTLDYRERATLVSVAAGSSVCDKAPATMGTPGKNVCGQLIPATPGKDVSFQAGENVTLSEDGKRFIANKNGVVIVQGTTVSVQDLFAVPGDVSFKTGNIRSDQSAVNVRGGVRRGFSVESNVFVSIQDTVEDAVIKSGGDVEVRGGIVLGPTGYVLARGSVSAVYAHSARIEAGGDIRLRNEAIHCNLKALGKILVNGPRGRLTGGVAVAGRGIEVKQLGADTGMETRVILGAGSLDFDQLNGEIRTLQAELAHVLATIGPDFTLNDVLKLPATIKRDPRKVQEMIEMVNRRDQGQKTLQLLQERRQQLVSDARRDSIGAILVRDMLYPGVTISIMDKHLKITTEMKRCRIGMNHDTGKIDITPLR